MPSLTRKDIAEKFNELSTADYGIVGEIRTFLTTLSEFVANARAENIDMKFGLHDTPDGRVINLTSSSGVLVTGTLEINKVAYLVALGQDGVEDCCVYLMQESTIDDVRALAEKDKEMDGFRKFIYANERTSSNIDMDDVVEQFQSAVLKLAAVQHAMKNCDTHRSFEASKPIDLTVKQDTQVNKPKIKGIL